MELTCIVEETEEEQEVSLSVTVGDQKSESRIVAFEFAAIRSDLVATMRAVAIVAIIIILLVWMAVTAKRDDKIIKAASFLFSSIMLLGALITICAVFLLSETTEPRCTLPLFIIAIGFDLLYGTLVLKNYRILKLFRDQNMRPELIKDSSLVIVSI